jgi:hypothetical protein
MARLHAAKKRDPKTITVKEMSRIAGMLLRDPTSETYQGLVEYFEDNAPEVGAAVVLDWLAGVVSETTEAPLPYFPLDKTGEPVSHDDYVGDMHDADGNVTRTAAAAVDSPPATQPDAE